MKASVTILPVSREAAMIWSISVRVSVIGFSHSTCLPARSALIVDSACRLLGSGLKTTSISGSASKAS